MRPRIFIGSSTEGLYAAEYVKDYFSVDYDCVVWNDNVFKYNNSFLETLLNSASLFDFGFLIFTKDDLAIVRDEAFEEARDNVIFEYGLFLGRLGVERAFILAEEGVKIPSDFLGITLAQIPTSDGLGGEKVVMPDKMDAELAKLKKLIDDYVRLGHLGLLPSTVIAISYYENFVKLVSDWINDNIGAIPCGEKKFATAKLKIVIPSDLDADIKKRASIYYRKQGLSDSAINSKGRNYPVHFADKVEGDEMVIYDMPTILNGIDKAIDMYFRTGHIGKSEEQQFAEEREMGNFERVLRLLIQQDAFCRDCVEIIEE